MLFAFLSAVSYPQLYVKQGTNPTIRDDRGTVIWDPNFNISTAEDQQWLYDFCQTLSYNASELEVRAPVEGRSTVICFMESFRSWYNTLDTGKNNSADVFPVNGSHCAAGTDEACYYEALNRFWADTTLYSDGLTQQTNYDRWIDYMFAERTGSGGSILRFHMIEVQTDLLYSLDFNDGIDYYDKYEAFMKAQLDTAPVHLKSGFHMTTLAWEYFFMQDVLIREAFQGLGLSLVFALIILLFATANWVRIR